MAGEAQNNQADLPQQSPKDSAVIYDNACCLYKYTLIKIVVRWIQDGHTIEWEEVFLSPINHSASLKPSTRLVTMTLEGTMTTPIINSKLGLLQLLWTTGTTNSLQKMHIHFAILWHNRETYTLEIPCTRYSCELTLVQTRYCLWSSDWDGSGIMATKPGHNISLHYLYIYPFNKGKKSYPPH